MIIKGLISAALVAFFLYTKLLPHKDKLALPHRSSFELAHKLFTPIIDSLDRLFPPMEIGQGLAINRAQLFIFIILVILLLIL